MRILLVDDEPRLRALVRRGLTEEGHVVETASTGPDALELGLGLDLDVIVLDLMLPGCDGLDVLRQLRAAGRRTPLLLLTARDTTADIVTGLNAGADDYLTKPFSFDVLAARVRALGRRGPAAQNVILRVDDLALDPAGRSVSRSGRPVALTPTEFRLLEALMRRAGRVVSRDALIDHVWGSGRDVESNTLDAFVRLLRNKVDVPGRPPLIHTARGVGYTMRESP